MRKEVINNKVCIIDCYLDQKKFLKDSSWHILCFQDVGFRNTFEIEDM